MDIDTSRPNLRILNKVGNSGIALPGARLQRLIDDLGTTLLEVIEAHGPLDVQVTGVTIFDAHDDFFISPGELLLGVGVATQAEMASLIERLARLHAAALVVKAPHQVSAGLRDAVRTHSVPLLGLTRAASWFQVAVLLRTLLDRWTATGPENLAGSPAGDLFAFANAISALVDAPVTVEDRSSRVLAFSGRQDEADTGRIETILRRQVPQRYRQMLEERGIFRELYRSRRPVYMPALDPDLLPRVAVSVQAGQEVLGSLWVAVKEPLSDERMQALTEAAGLAALHMLHQRNSADLARQLSTDLLESVLSGGAGAHEAAIRLGLPGSPLCVLACQPLGAQPAGLEAAGQRLADALTLHLSAIHADAAVARIGRLVYAVVPVSGHCEPDDASRHIHGLAASFVARIGPRDPVVIGVGGPAQSLQGLARARAEAERTVRVLRESGPGGRAARFDDVYLETVLDRLREVLEDDQDRSYGPVAKLIGYDAANGTALTDSLHAYLEAFGDVGRAAAAVHVHPNTFRYRLRRIWEVGGIDLEDSRARLAALLQLSAIRPRG
jgi:PucR C-terminal helix-turn-helix domain/Purine catabolism regulatory protein-like family/GGDEF-like domain